MITLPYSSCVVAGKSVICCAPKPPHLEQWDNDTDLRKFLGGLNKTSYLKTPEKSIHYSSRNLNSSLSTQATYALSLF